jgi:hypothetical protein
MSFRKFGSNAVKFVLAFSVVGVLAGEAFAAVVDQPSNDITVLKAFDTGYLIDGLNPNECQVLKEDRGTVTLDCTSVVENVIVSRYPNIVGPLARSVELLGSRNSSTGEIQISSYYCRSLEIQTVIRNAALASVQGIGFSFNGTLHTVPAQKLQPVLSVRLKDGAEATVHRFQAPAFCWQGSMTSSSNASYTFKPFAQYVGLDGNTYRNWDVVPSDYKLGRIWPYDGRGQVGPWVSSFDRSRELLP